MRSKLMGHALFVGLLIVVLWADATPGAQAPAADAAQETTVAGCLQTVADEGGFVLVTDDKQTYHIQATEGVELAPHANHRVELTGSVEKSETNTVLKVTALKMVASSCEG